MLRTFRNMFDGFVGFLGTYDTAGALCLVEIPFYRWILCWIWNGSLPAGVPTYAMMLTRSWACSIICCTPAVDHAVRMCVWEDVGGRWSSITVQLFLCSYIKLTGLHLLSQWLSSSKFKLFFSPKSVLFTIPLLVFQVYYYTVAPQSSRLLEWRGGQRSRNL